MELLLIYRPRRDGRLSWPSWLTHSGRLTHEVVTRQPWIRRRSEKDQRNSASEMTYIVSSGALNSTHLLTYLDQRKSASYKPTQVGNI